MPLYLFVCFSVICANLATAPGSFSVNGFKVWSNASVVKGTVIKTDKVPVTIFIGPDRRMVVAPHSEVVFSGSAGGATGYRNQWTGEREQRPMSQRP